MSLQCVVVGGGLGTRMRALTGSLPKSLIPVLGRAFADWQLEHLASQGVKRLVYCTGYRGEMLRRHVGDGSRFGLAVTWVNEGARLLGTGGALRLAFDQGALDEAFYVLYGDSYLLVDLTAVERAWNGSGLPAIMTVMRNEGRWDASNAIFASGRVTCYDKRRPEPHRSQMRWIDYGLSLLERDVVAKQVRSASIVDLADVLRDLSLTGQLAGLEVDERFYEVGSPQGLSDFEEYLERGCGARADRHA